jgi:DtxR family Mn-dependent transcriptional regulator
MYLVMIALLRDDVDAPLPLSLLAQKLSISPVSANEMCRKLADQSLVQYQPYKGVTLTTAGETMAQDILSRRRLWELFLVQELGIAVDEADAIACRLEHIPSSALIVALRQYLEHVHAPPFGNACAGCVGAGRALAHSLSSCAVGQRGRLVGITADGATTEFLHSQGLDVHNTVTVLAVGDDGTLLLDAGTRRLTLAAPLADQIHVVGEEIEG